MVAFVVVVCTFIICREIATSRGDMGRANEYAVCVVAALLVFAATALFDAFTS